MTSQTPEHRGSWSQYWRVGALTTFKGGRFDRGYDGSARDFFLPELDHLKGKSAVVLDLATGNGGLALLAAQSMAAFQPACRIIGIDYAEISPGADPMLTPEQRRLMRSIDFRGGVGMEQTGLAAHSVDLAISAYGFEYGQVDAILDECRRILKPGARLAFLMHDRDSVIVRQAESSVRLLDLALDEMDLAGVVMALLECVGAATSKEEMMAFGRRPESERRRHALNDALARLYASVAGDADMEDLAHQIGSGFLEIFTRLRSMPLAGKLEALRKGRQDWIAFRKRLQHMLNAAVDDRSATALARSAAERGFAEIEISELRYGSDNVLIGRTMRALSSPAT